MPREPRLVAPKGTRKNWAVEYYDPAKGFTTRSSLGTTDAGLADKLYAEWCLNYHWESEKQRNTKVLALAAQIVSGNGHDRLAETTVEELVSLFYSQVAKNFPSKYAYKSALSYVSDKLPGVTMREFKRRRQERFIEDLKNSGLAEGTVSRIMAAVSTAIKRAYAEEEREKPYIIAVTSDVTRQRLLTDEEAKSVIDSAKTEAAKRFITLAFLTAGRPQAIIDLTPAQFDLERGLIDLNPPGRKQNPKKYRPTIPMGKILSPMVKEWGDGPIFVVGTDQRREVKHYRPLSESLTYPEGATLYCVRHTVAVEMRRQGVPEMDISAFLGHKPPGVSKTTLGYAKHRPEYLTKAREAVDAYWERVNGCREVIADRLDSGAVSEGHPGGGGEDRGAMDGCGQAGIETKT